MSPAVTVGQAGCVSSWGAMGLVASEVALKAHFNMQVDDFIVRIIITV